MHVVRRVCVELSAAEAEGFALSRDVRDWSREQLPQLLARECDELAGPAEHLRVERIEVQVIVDRLEDWRTSAARQLREQLMACSHGEHGPCSVVPPARAFAEALALYLEHGTLPWSLLERTPKALRGRVRRWVVEGGLASEGAPVRAVLASPAAARRLLELLPEAVLDDALATLCQEPAAEVRAWRADARACAAGPRVTCLLREQLSCGQDAQARTARAVSWLDDVASFPTTFRSALFQGALDVIEAGRKPPAAGTRSEPIRSESTSAEEAPRRRPASRDHHEVSLREGIFVPNAGVVLAAAFLTRLFERLGIAAERRLLDLPRALGVVHHLATGERAPLDLELPLAKVLCGSAIERGFELEPLDDAACLESELLLNTMLQHWATLGNTSPSTLRGSFLGRPGKLLQAAPAAWTLIVEPHTFDVLLPGVPWNFSLVRLPWMTALLNVEWAH